MILRVDNIKSMLFAILCICFIFYLFLGIYSYKRDQKSKINVTFLILCISTSLWAIGYAFMLISPNIEIANIWRIVSAIGRCFFCAMWISFAFSLKSTTSKSYPNKLIVLIYIFSTLFFIDNLMYQPSKVLIRQYYGWVWYIPNTIIGNTFHLFFSIVTLAGLIIVFLWGRDSKKNRIKKQTKIILITSSISMCLGVSIDIISPMMGIRAFPLSVVTDLIAVGGIWYAINKHKMLSLSYELVSEYLFEAVNEPIFILGEDFLVKHCNEVTLNITGYNHKDLEQNSLDTIINFRNFNFNTIMQRGNIINIEVDLLRENNSSLVCELSATVIYDEYKDILGIITLLHDVSERKMIAEIQKKYTLKLEESNLKFKNEITNRLLAENKIRHFVYYDALTEIFNRKKMLEDVNLMLDNKIKEFAILFIDLDKFKSANDNYGHQVGDGILKTVAVRLKNIIMSTDTIYRIGGDEFIILLRNLNSSANVEKIAVAVVETLGAAFNYNGNQLFIGCSIGISLFPKHGVDADTLIKNADLAMYELKRKGGNGYKVYSLKTGEENLNNYNECKINSKITI